MFPSPASGSGSRVGARSPPVPVLSDEQVEDIRRRLETEGKVEPTFTVAVTDEHGAVVAEVEKLLHIRRKASARQRELVA